MNPKEILAELRRLVALKEIETNQLFPDSGFKSGYEPIRTYLRQLQKEAKPETAAEGLFRSLVEIFFNAPVVPQVGLGSGFVDFKLDAKEESSIVIELKPLFRSYSADWLKSFPLEPASHHAQIQKYLQHSEYVILTDLRDAYLYSARDVWEPTLKPFKKISFADLLENALARRSLLDVVRDAEDGEDRPDLDRAFFKDLQDWFRAFASVRFKDENQHDELVIQLLNQLIFAKTMEDYSLVRYRQLQDDWSKAKERWSAKGSHRIVWQFLKDFEEFFEDYYDTELFERSIWNELDPADQKNLDRFARLLEAVLGMDDWSKTFQRGIVHYNYRRIDEDIFGKSYEMFLAANRKDEGIFYTPAGITTPMADSLVDGLFNPLTTKICEAIGAKNSDFAAAEKLMAELSQITICDTASGSGGFLIKVLRAVWRHYLRIETACRWVNNWQNGGDLLDIPANIQHALEFRKRWNFKDNYRDLVAQILLRHIFAVDKDAGAIEVAKTNLWKEAVKLSTDDYNFRRLTGDINRTLPSLRLNFVCADSLVDTDPAKQVAYLTEVCGDAMKKLCTLRQKYIFNPSNHAPLNEALALIARLRENLTEHFQAEPLPAPAIFIALSFFPAWFGQAGKAKVAQASRLPAPKEKPANADETSALPSAGFDGVIGNPPWEGFKPIAKEFVAKLKTNFSKYTMAGTDFTPWFNQKLKDEPEFRKRWDEYVSGYESYAEFFSRRFKFQGGGDINLYKLFIEANLSLVRDGGRLSLLVPSGLQTDEGCGPLRKLLLGEHFFEELTSFENRGYIAIENGKEKTKHIFPDVDSRFKFGFFKVIKGQTPDNQHTFDSRFYLQDPKDVSAPPIKYSVEMIRRFSPENFGIMEFRSKRDYELCAKIRGGHPLLKDLGFRLSTELHMTNDNHFFRKLTGKKVVGQLPLYEGKMIHQFDAKFSPGNYAVVEKEVREELLRKEIYRLAKLVREVEPKKLEGKAVPEERAELDERLHEIFKAKKFKLQFEYERIAYREIGSSTNERTLIATLIPKDACLNHKLIFFVPFEYELDPKGNLKQVDFADEDMNSVLSLLNSLIVNYYLRSRVSTSVSMFYIYELPIPKLSTTQKKKLADFAAKLMKNPRAVKERAALETFIARELYELSLDDWKHLTSTFTFGGGESKAELDEIIRLSLANWK